MRKIWFYMLVVLLGLGVLSCLHNMKLQVKNLYTDPQFTARRLSNVKIAVLPLLSAQGPVRAEELKPRSILELVRKTRPGIDWSGTDEFELSFKNMGGLSKLKSFYSLIFEGNVLALNGADSLWNAVEHSLLLTFRLKSGATVRSFDIGQKKQFDIECELWDSAKREVLWRSVCHGESSDGQVADSRLLVETMRRLVEEIPAVQPGYESGSW
ncbi:MAG: hypothetical protein ACLFVE_03705 [Chitinispirillaceae bacterium]